MGKYNFMRRWVLFIAIPLLGWGESLRGQADAVPMEKLEDSLVGKIEALHAAKKDGTRKKAHLAFRDLLKETLKRKEAAFSHPFSELSQKMAVLGTGTDKFRLFNWNLPKNDLTHEYFLYMLIRRPDGSIDIKHAQDGSVAKDKTTTRRRSTDRGKKRGREQKERPDGRPIEYERRKVSNWPGALYYELIPFENARHGRTEYILLGWDGNDKMSNKKLIDVLSFGRNDEVRFGSNVFTGEGKTKTRVLFEYTAKATMSLKYQEDKDRIVFDHLSPKQSNLEGMYEYYGPDLSFDAYQHEDGAWHFERDVEAKMEDMKQRNWNDPNE